MPRTDRQEALASWLKVLAEPNRLRIFDLLMQGEQCNCEMGDTLGMAPNLISHHLAVLQKAGLVEARRDESDARWIHYSVNTAVLADLNDVLGRFFDPARIQSREPFCPPPSFFVRVTQIRERAAGAGRAR